MREDLEKDLASAFLSDEDKKKLEDDLKEINSQIIDVENELWSKVGEAITKATDLYKKEIEDMLKATNEQLDLMLDKFNKNSTL